MAVLTINVSGVKEIEAALRRANPGTNPRITPGILKAFAVPIQRNAVDKQIAAGGGGKGKQLKPLPRKLTGRTGRLQGDIHIDKRPLPRGIEIGPDVKYGAVHEFGKRVVFGLAKVASHTRKVAFGKKVAPFTVPSYIRSGYSAKYPKRAFMAPALKAVSPRFPEIAVREWKKEARL